MSDLMELLERVKAATGPDRELDYAISRFADGELVRHSSLHLPYSASIDDALALVERKLPGSLISLTQMSANWQVSVLEVDSDNPDSVAADWVEDAPTAPLAILGALLSALTSGASS